SSPGIEPGLAASKAAVRPPHPRVKSRVPSPEVEPGPRPSGGRVPSVTRRGRNRSRRPGSNRHEPAYKATRSRPAHSTKTLVILGYTRCSSHVQGFTLHSIDQRENAVFRGGSV